MSNPRVQLAILIALNLIWTPVNFAITAASEFATPTAIAVLRWIPLTVFIWAGLQFPSVRRVLQVVFPDKRGRWVCLLSGFLLAGPSHLIYYFALQQTNSVDTTIINTTGPFWISIGAVALLREQISFRLWVAILLGIVGAYVVAIGFQAPALDSSRMTGNLLYLLGSLMESLSFVVVTRIVRRSSGVGAFSYELLGISLAMIVVPLIFRSAMPFEVREFGPGLLGPLAFLIFGAGLIAWGVWYIIAEQAPVSYMIVTLGIQAPAAALLGYLLTRAPIETHTVAGTALIILALVISAANRKNSGEELPIPPVEPS